VLRGAAGRVSNDKAAASLAQDESCRQGDDEKQHKRDAEDTQ
jgi:hypothetical protein